MSNRNIQNALVKNLSTSKKGKQMKKIKDTCGYMRQYVFAASVLLTLFLAVVPGTCFAGIEPDADKILRAMSSYLGELKTLSMKADIDFEIITNEGQKLQISSYATMVMERPDKFHITRKGMIADAEFFYDGEVLTLLGKNLNVYSQTAVSGTIEDAIVAYEFETGIPAPGADLMFTDSYSVISEGSESGFYLGTTYVGGVECHHLAIRKADIDLQVWIKAGDEPLPMKYIITTKWLTAAPQYEIRLRDWDTSPKISDQLFKFSVPEGAEKLETMVSDELDGIISTWGGEK